MSGLIVGLVLRLKISPEFNSEAKFIATVYADHAWEDGTHAHPAVETVARITGFSERTIQRYLRALESMGVMVRQGKGPRGTNNYAFPLTENEDGSVRLNFSRGDSLTPRQPDGGDTESGDTESGDTESGDSIVSPEQTNNPSFNVLVVVKGDIAKKYEQEFGGLTPMIAEAIRDAEQTYPLDWIPEAMQIAVESNKRSWNYVLGILKNCKAKNIRPALNKLEAKHGNAGTNSSKTAPRKAGAGKVRKADHRSANSEYSAADLAAADLINQSVGVR